MFFILGQHGRSHCDWFKTRCVSFELIFFNSRLNEGLKAAKVRPHNGWRRGTAVRTIFPARVP